MKLRLIAGLSLTAGMAMAAAPTATITDFSQNGRLVTIAYNLSGDAVVTAEILTNGVPIGAEKCTSMYGDVNKAVAGGNGRSIHWRPDKSMNGECYENAYAKLTVWALDAPPNYCVIDLCVKSNVNYYACAEAVPLGVTNEVYKKDKLVLRKIPAKGVQFMMGTAGSSTEIPHKVDFTDDFYMGIYEITQGQAKRIWKDSWSKNKNHDDSPMRPTESCNYNIIRGSNTLAPNSHALTKNADNGLLLRLNEFSGMLCDLPTEAQWEFACRAGSGGTYYYASDSAADLSQYAWYNCSETQVVGQRLPNEWGLYDMLGNVGERVLDYYYDGKKYSDGSDVTDPYGYISGSEGNTAERVVRGGNYATTDTTKITCAYRSQKYWQNEPSGGYGYRLWSPGTAYVRR